LKAKARLWWCIASGIVFAIFGIALWMFPADWWRILIVAAGWLFFSRSLAEKSVTLVTAPTSSGEMEPVPTSRRWAALLGTFAFGSGVITQAWHSAIIGVVFSAVTAAAMWQNLRARLPFLFDPWSEKLPPAPTLMHAMIGIAGMVEVVGIVTGITYAAGGQANLWLARAISYGAVGLVAFFFMHRFLRERGVSTADVWLWSGKGQGIPQSILHSGAVLLGLLLGGAALLYQILLSALPMMQETMQELAKVSAAHQGQKFWLCILAIVFAPLAEEYFFRGLLYRALDREWGGWQAWVGSAAFFAIYHPPLAWLPVFALGLVNAWLFKTTGRLLPCVLLHMAYNSVVVLAM
jgi:membrane protease YdiL (CAAX protease family)